MKRYFIFVALMVFLPVTHADKDHNESSKNIVVTSVIQTVQEYDVPQLIIRGSNFLRKGPPAVLIDDETDLVIAHAEDTVIFADLPDGSLLPGDYLLRVVEGGNGRKKNKKTFEWNLTIGAVGPQGEQGPPGEDGANGQDGEDGLNGQDGLKGDKGEQGPPGKDGENGQNGEDGEDGLQGPPGQQGRDGTEGLNGADGKEGAPGIAGDSCSVSQEGNSAIIRCDDGSAATIAGAGKVIVFSEGQLEIPAYEYSTELPVLIDADGVNLGTIQVISNGVYNIPVQVVTDDIRFVNVINEAQSVLVASVAADILYFSGINCTGPVFVRNNTGIYYDSVSDKYWAASRQSTAEKVYLKSRIYNSYASGGRFRPSSACSNAEYLIDVVIAGEFHLPPELENARYPVAAQIP